MSDEAELFVDLLEATVSSARNYHHLYHCSLVGGSRPTSGFRFKEETITDLLIGELAGREYRVEAACPLCSSDDCYDWNGDPVPGVGGIRIRALTKHEEGGDRRTGKSGAHADFILAIRRQDPRDSRDLSRAKELRILVQAKRVNPSELEFRPKPTTQYDKLVEAARKYGAVPYYALYVQQLSPHLSTPTGCPRARAASDRSVVLVAAHASSHPRALPHLLLTDILGEARPLRCLVDCTCLGPGARRIGYSDPSQLWNAALQFISRDFPNYQGTTASGSLPPDVPAVRPNLSEYKYTPARTRSNDQTMHPGARGQRLGNDRALLIRLGPQEDSPTPGRRFIGYGPGMSSEELRDAARMYWRLDRDRARRVRYLVISANRQVLDVCEVIPDGVTFIETAEGGRRVAFTVTDIADSELRDRLLVIATQKIGQLRPGNRAPCIYLSDEAAQ